MFSFRQIIFGCVSGAAVSFGVIGCQPEQRPEFIPSSAQIMDSGNGKIHYTADADGMVYIYDHQQNKLVWSGNVLKGQALDIDPMRNQVMANGAIVTMKTLNAGDVNDVYFMPAPVTAAAPAAPMSAQPANNNANRDYGSVTVTPSVTVQPNTAGQPANSVTVQSGLNVAPTTQPTGSSAH